MKRRLMKLFRSRNQAGHSLVEAMVAMGVLGVGMLGVAQMIPAALSNVGDAQQRTNGIQAAQVRMEELKTSDYDSAALVAGTYTESTGSYELAWTITDDTPTTGCKRVDLSATWQDIKGPQDVELTTYVTRR